MATIHTHDESMHHKQRAVIHEMPTACVFACIPTCVCWGGWGWSGAVCTFSGASHFRMSDATIVTFVQCIVRTRLLDITSTVTTR